MKIDWRNPPKLLGWAVDGIGLFIAICIVAIVYLIGIFASIFYWPKKRRCK